MGTVYRALDRSTGGTVALKLLHSQPSDTGRTDVAARFGREAQILAGLEHPGIVRYVDHGVAADGAPYLAMEWLEGTDLEARLRQGPLPRRGSSTRT
jgi:serine/threonine protein kinase